MPKREQLEQMLQSDPDDLFIKYALGIACLTEGDVEAGLQTLEEVIQQDADYVPAYFQAGQALAGKGDVSAAQEMLRTGIVVAQRTGEKHAAMEMTEFLNSI